MQIDHVVPLSAAWDLGAHRWPAAKRKAFANDPRNLLATASGINRAKSDDTPAQWMPHVRGDDRRCAYATRYRDVSAAYGLPVPKADMRALMVAMALCA